MPEQYAENKIGEAIDKTTPTYQYTKETYGTVVYQEQLLLICVFVGGLEWFEADLVLKANKHGFKERAVAILNKYAEDNGVDLHKKFIKNAVKNGMTKDQAEGTWNSLLVYSFNKGTCCWVLHHQHGRNVLQDILSSDLLVYQNQVCP